MKIGILIRSPQVVDGGAATFADNIMNETKNVLSRHQFVYCYKGKAFSTVESTVNGIRYLNVTAFARKYYFKLVVKRWKLRINGLKYYLTFRPVPKPEVSFWDIMADKYEIDLYWFTYPVMQVLSTPYIYTLWDLGHRVTSVFPEVSKPIEQWNARELMYQTTVYRATYILTGNETGKKEIIENYPVCHSKVRIVPFPISNFCYGDEKKPDQAFPEDYFFYPAQIIPHKNHVCIIEALKILRQKYGLSPNVIFTGKHTSNLEYVMQLAQQYNVSKQVYRVGYVSDEELKYLYKHSIALVFASLMGPNNLPPLEAAYLGCPVLICDIEGHKEQMGDSAMFFDGLDAEDLAEKMFRIMTDSEKRKEMVRKGYDLAKKYQNNSYVKCVIKIIDEFSKIRGRWG